MTSPADNPDSVLCTQPWCLRRCTHRLPRSLAALDATSDVGTDRLGEELKPAVGGAGEEETDLDLGEMVRKSEVAWLNAEEMKAAAETSSSAFPPGQNGEDQAGYQDVIWLPVNKLMVLTLCSHPAT